MIPSDIQEEARSGARGRLVSGGDGRPRGLAKIQPGWLLIHHRRAWDSTLWFLGWNSRRPDCNPAYLRILMACG